MTEKYAPSKGDYIRVQGNKQYLPVPQRVQWMRGEHPDWGIHTRVHALDWDVGYVIMRADVVDGNGHILGQGTKTETRKGFSDFVEKAETGAVGRALARAGYGTEDALDLEGDRFADAPIEKPERSERASSVRREDSKPATTSAPAPRTAEENALLDQIKEAAKRHNVGHTQQRLIADALGIPKGQHATADQLRAMIERFIESPGRGVPTAAPAPEQPSATDGDGAAPVARGGESSESPPPTAGLEGAVSPSLPSGPALDPQTLLESAQAIVGGELVDVVPPELQARIERARAKGKAKPDDEDEVEQIRAGLAS
jgi:hypothetical protein